MAIVIDSCSLVSVARYYLPLDKEGIIVPFLKSVLNSGEVILLDAVVQEVRFTAKGIAIKAMPFLDDKKYIKKTEDLIPPAPKRFDNLLDNNFCIGALKKELTNEQYISQKKDYLQSGDGKIIVFSQVYKKEQALLFNDFFVLTEESRTTNDGKLFKKLPLICDELDIKTLTLPDYLKANGFIINKD